MDEMKSRIIEQITDGRLDSEDLENLFQEIKDNFNEEEQQELFNFFINNLKESLQSQNLSQEDAYGFVRELRENMTTYGGLSDTQIDEIFNSNDFNAETISNEETKDEEREIEKINNRINELEQELNIGRDLTSEELEQLIEEKTAEIEKSKSSNPIGNAAELKEEYEKLKKKIDDTELNPEDMMYPEFGKDKERLAELEEKIYNLPENKTARLKEEYEKLKKKIDDTELNPEDMMYPEFGKDKERLAELEEEIYNLPENKTARLKEEYEKLKKKIDDTELNPEDMMYPEFKKDKERLAELEKEIYNLPENKLARLKEEYEKLKKKIDDTELNPEDMMYPEFKKDKERLAELEKEIKDLEREMDGLEPEIDQKAVEDLKKLEEYKRLKEIRNAYIKIQSEAIGQLEEQKLNDAELDSAINDFVENHELVGALDKYENADLLKEQLKEDIKNHLKAKKVEKKEQNKKLLYKGLAAVGGFVTGLGLSCVPGVGTIKMGIAATKLVVSGVNFWSKKHPDGKIAKIKNIVVNGINKIPGAPKVIECINKMREKLKSSPWNCFINGMAAGYITGNLIELFTGETILEHLKPDPVPEPTPIPEPIPEPTPTPVPEPTPIPEPIPVTELTLNEGDVIDLSALAKGSASPGGTMVNVMEDTVGKTAVFDKIKVAPDGKVWWHFKQLNGAGYAWFPAEDVQEVISQAASVGSKTL